jgi:pyrimidine deaminase RibD-like protein
MTARKLMKLAIAELEKCKPPDPVRVPKVGAVIAIDDEMIAAAHRGEEHHAEKLALEQIKPGRNLTQATVYTTLEPCTHRVRTKPGESCAERLIRMAVKKVVIGILDPNQGVCGKGLLQLQQAKIEVELFPNDLAQRIRQLIDPFIQAQQGLGIRITAPENGVRFRGQSCQVKGTFTNPPGENVFAITNITDQWWPQLSQIRVIPEKYNEWEVTVNFGYELPHKVYIVRASDLGMGLINQYYKMIIERQQAIKNTAVHFQLDEEKVRQVIAPNYWSISMAKLPKGLDLEDCIEINVTSLSIEGAGQTNSPAPSDKESGAFGDCGTVG